MKKFQFLLLDAGPVMRLFQLDIWDRFIEKCDVTMSRITVNEVKHTYSKHQIKKIDLLAYEQNDLISLFDIELSKFKELSGKLPNTYSIHDGEKETLVFMFDSSEDWRVCTTDKVVFRLLGLIGRGKQGISLEEILKHINLDSGLNWENITPQDKNWPYTKRFREKHTQEGQEDSASKNNFRNI